MRHYCTIVDENYLVRGLTLHASMERHCQPYCLWILALTGGALKVLDKLALPNVKVVPFSSVETSALKTARAGRTWVEYVWTCKSSWILWVLRQPAVDSMVYVDADSYFFAGPASLFDEIGDNSLAITPHRFSPDRKYLLANGVFNAGFIYARQYPQALHCLQAWAQQCIDWCYSRHEGDRYMDQKYLNTWPKVWGAHVIRHKGVNLAPWNQAGQYQYSMRGERVYVGSDPLIWYHFHQGLKPSYRLAPFMKAHIYKPYRKALDRARRMTHL